MDTFDRVSAEYGEKSVIQQNAAARLIDLLELRRGESVLDVACGPGNLTSVLAKSTGGRVVGTDISEGMIEQARASYPGIEFRRVAAEDLDYAAEFDVVFCNSAFQWFKEAGRATDAMRAALVDGGRIGLACPSTPDFAPWFNSIVEAVSVLPEIAPTFSHYRKPWFHLPDRDAYQAFFEEHGFKTKYISLGHEVSMHTVDEAFGVYSAGAAQGYVGQASYDVELSDEYLAAFSAAVRREMESRAAGGLVEVDFNRLYYIALR